MYYKKSSNISIEKSLIIYWEMSKTKKIWKTLNIQKDTTWFIYLVFACDRRYNNKVNFGVVTYS